MCNLKQKSFIPLKDLSFFRIQKKPEPLAGLALLFSILPQLFIIIVSGRLIILICIPLYHHGRVIIVVVLIGEIYYFVITV